MRNLVLFVAVSLAVFVSSTASSLAQQGEFIGQLILNFTTDPRKGTLEAQFGYKDPEARIWMVPAKTVVDGASIPWPLWSIIGSPWTGSYRKASVIHDYYCETKDRGWRNVHKVFYDAMLTDKTPTVQAKIMYAAVLQFGPKWKKEFGIDGKPRLVSYQPPFDKDRLDKTIEWIKSENPSIEEIDGLVQ